MATEYISRTDETAVSVCSLDKYYMKVIHPMLHTHLTLSLDKYSHGYIVRDHSRHTDPEIFILE